jgi:pimeloyl-ACP methyl ester carboxylesterase
MQRLLTVFATVVLISPALLLASDEPLAVRNSFDSHGVKISYVVGGKGEPVVLIHGLMSSCLMNWQLPGVFTMLAKNYQVIAIDCPGHGESDKPKKDEAYGVEMVEHVIRLLDTLKIDKAHIIGYSMGGMISAKLVAKHPERVKSVILAGMGWLQDGSFLQKSWDFLGKNDMGSVPAECVRNLGKLALSEDELMKIKAPVKVIVGDQDPCRGLYVIPLQKMRKDWPVVEIKNAGHLDCVIKQELKDEIKKWLDQPTKK